MDILHKFILPIALSIKIPAAMELYNDLCLKHSLKPD